MTTSRNSKVKVALFGLGKMGSNHLRVLSMLNSVSIEYVFDTDQWATSAATQKYGVTSTNQLPTTFDDIDAVVICTPTVTHQEYLEKFIPEVRNIFVEKPLTHSLKGAESITSLANTYQTNIQVGFIERFNPAIGKLREILYDANDVAFVDFIRTNRLSSRITDVDVIYDLMIHDLDLALFLNGPVDKVSAHGKFSGDMVSLVSATLTHTNGTLSRIFSSRISDKKIRLIQATCDHKFLDCDLLKKEVVTHASPAKSTNAEELSNFTTQLDIVSVPPQEALLLELQNFIDSCQKLNTVAKPDVNDGLAAIRLCDVIQKQIAA